MPSSNKIIPNEKISDLKGFILVFLFIYFFRIIRLFLRWIHFPSAVQLALSGGWVNDYFFSLAYCTTHSDEFETQMKIVKASKSFLLS